MMTTVGDDVAVDFNNDRFVFFFAVNDQLVKLEQSPGFGGMCVCAFL
jgi:hypothetical protein